MRPSGRVVLQLPAGTNESLLPEPVAYPGLPGVAKTAVHEADGCRLNVVEFGGGSEVPAHASPGVCHWFVLDGEIVSMVPGREDHVLRTGDLCVQVDIEHGWRVPAGGHARLLAVVVDPRTSAP